PLLETISSTELDEVAELNEVVSNSSELEDFNSSSSEHGKLLS
nr:hypothetical protein [Tanacetum cinerariifolium]